MKSACGRRNDLQRLSSYSLEPVSVSAHGSVWASIRTWIIQVDLNATTGIFKHWWQTGEQRQQAVTVMPGAAYC